MRLAARRALIGLCLWGLAVSAAAAEPAAYQQVPTVLHVHSRMSTGEQTLDELAADARRYGVGALVMTDNLVLRYEYGLFPLRGVLRWQRSWPSIDEFGVERYLEALRAAAQRNPDMVFVPGVEVVAHYYWTGSLPTGDLTMHDGQKNLLLIGPGEAEFYEGIPASGHRSAYRWGARSAAGIAASLLCGGVGIWLLATGPAPRPGETRISSRRYQRRRRLGVAAVVLAVVLTINAFPFLQPPYDLYDAELGVRPHQAVIDYAGSHGALALWSMPEAPDLHKVDYGPFGTVTIKTDPYLPVLGLTEGYTGFGVAYAQPVHAAEPGGAWDLLLQAYCAGGRSTPVWGVAESAFHKAAFGKRLTEAETVVWVKERSQAEVIDALRQGRAYARRREPGFAYVLDEFTVSADAGATTATAISGERLLAEGPVTIRARVSASDDVPRSVTLRIIRGGTVIWSDPVTVPGEVSVSDAVPDGTKTFYRVLIGGGGARVVSNPIFVEPVMSQANGVAPPADGRGP